MPPDLAQHFLAKGREDEALLEKIVDDETISDGIFGFHVQQAIEKYVKAVLIRFGIRLPGAHDLYELFTTAEVSGAPVDIDADRADQYTMVGVEARYPEAALSEELPEPRADALSFVAEVRSWAEELLNKDPSN